MLVPSIGSTIQEKSLSSKLFDSSPKNENLGYFFNKYFLIVSSFFKSISVNKSVFPFLETFLGAPKYFKEYLPAFIAIYSASFKHLFNLDFENFLISFSINLYFLSFSSLVLLFLLKLNMLIINTPLKLKFIYLFEFL